MTTRLASLVVVVVVAVAALGPVVRAGEGAPAAEAVGNVTGGVPDADVKKAFLAAAASLSPGECAAAAAALFAEAVENNTLSAAEAETLLAQSREALKVRGWGELVAALKPSTGSIIGASPEDGNPGRAPLGPLLVTVGGLSLGGALVLFLLVSYQDYGMRGMAMVGLVVKIPFDIVGWRLWSKNEFASGVLLSVGALLPVIALFAWQSAGGEWKPYFGLDDASFSPDDDDDNDGNKGDSGNKNAGHAKVKRRRVRRKRRKTSNGTTGEPGGDGNGGGDGGAQPEMSSEDEDDDHIPEERMNNIQLTMTNFQIIDKLAEKTRERRLLTFRLAATAAVSSSCSLALFPSPMLAFLVVASGYLVICDAYPLWIAADATQLSYMLSRKADGFIRPGRTDKAFVVKFGLAYGGAVFGAAVAADVLVGGAGVDWATRVVTSGPAVLGGVYAASLSLAWVCLTIQPSKSPWGGLAYWTINLGLVVGGSHVLGRWPMTFFGVVGMVMYFAAAAATPGPAVGEAGSPGWIWTQVRMGLGFAGFAVCVALEDYGLMLASEISFISYLNVVTSNEPGVRHYLNAPTAAELQALRRALRGSMAKAALLLSAATLYLLIAGSLPDASLDLGWFTISVSDFAIWPGLGAFALAGGYFCMTAVIRGDLAGLPMLSTLRPRVALATVVYAAVAGGAKAGPFDLPIFFYASGVGLAGIAQIGAHEGLGLVSLIPAYLTALCWLLSDGAGFPMYALTVGTFLMANWAIQSHHYNGAVPGKAKVMVANALLVVFGVCVDSQTLTVIGGVWFYGVLVEVASTNMRNSLLFPIFLTVCGVFMIFLAVMYQKNVDSLRSLAFLPQLLSETLERSAGAT